MQSAPRLTSLELGGDGDEIYAIEEIEHCFGVELDKQDASQWRTVGDVFKSLRNALPPDRRDDPDVWQQFTEAISSETGVDPRLVGPDTELLGGIPIMEWLAETFQELMRKVRGA
ncbi:MAG TPA: hypothetical protein VG839_01730 [Asticcacaulis sp.]|nr:hypothetical protein [Asticcacaulis sp.]